jgi:hypothetical protein
MIKHKLKSQYRQQKGVYAKMDAQQHKWSN